MNKNISITKSKILSKHKYILKNVTYEYEARNGDLRTAEREVYDRGNGVAILLYNKSKSTVILTKQFRMPTYLNANDSGMLIEVCAGTLDEKNPADCIKREVLEETGYKIENVKKVFESYMSPGAVTEIIHFYVAEYDKGMKVSEGGGLEAEHENIEVLEVNFDDAFQMINTGDIKDSKTIMLLQHAKIQGLV
jgi:nudix-type nucleoside diphosphatase (YffH/AdpP family)